MNAHAYLAVGLTGLLTLIVSACRTVAVQPPAGTGGFLGIRFEKSKLKFFEQNPQVQYAIRVSEVVTDAPADKAGLEEGDMIIAIDGENFDSYRYDLLEEVFVALIAAKPPGSKLKLTVVRYQTEKSAVLNNKGLPYQNSEDIYPYIEQLKPTDHFTLKYEGARREITLPVVLGGRSAGAESAPAAFDMPPYKGLTEFTLSTASDMSVDVAAYEDTKRRLLNAERRPDILRRSHITYLKKYPEQLLSFAGGLAEKTESYYGTALTPAGIQNRRSKNTPLPMLPNTLTFMADVTADNTLSGNPSGAFIPEQHSVSGADEVSLLQLIDNIWQQAETERAKAFAGMTSDELAAINQLLPKLMQNLSVSFTPQSYILNSKDKKLLRRFAERIDMSALVKSYRILSGLTSASVMTRLKTYAEQKASKQIFKTTLSSGAVLVMGTSDADNHLQAADILIDPSGNDRYLQRSVPGNDIYSGTEFCQGAGFRGVNILLDVSGNDVYRGLEFCQGAAFAGIGILTDLAGNDDYAVRRFGQGAGLLGFAVLNDFAGDDSYRAAGFSQSAAGPGLVSLLYDRTGKDRYTVSAGTESAYGDYGIFNGSSQGFGYGLRGFLSGGIAFLIDRAGNDEYEGGEFSQGGGYYYGAGILHDYGGDDVYSASRYSRAFGAHAGIGIMIEKSGNDRYESNGGAVYSAAWDLSVSAFCDESGDDAYYAEFSNFALGAADHNGYAYFCDLGGSDLYHIAGYYQPVNDYHGGASFSFFSDTGGGSDYYPLREYRTGRNQILSGNRLFIDR
ncbi:hypothetical protein CHS0354_018568 [Potamilus streckersoni]|uniref:PDZ domain-containing protein n=1 Tax=Potamilus streckersoni TaxID=2493646 RepID=A0AAE0TAN1_9BIVA|nr:hypothetical protein CHS0354_018568 [Potamilus streckersoni]